MDFMAGRIGHRASGTGIRTTGYTDRLTAQADPPILRLIQIDSS